MPGQTPGAPLVAVQQRTKLAFLRYVLMPIGYGVRRKFRATPLPLDLQLETLDSTFQGPGTLKDALEEAVERTMETIVVGLKAPWLVMETGEHNYAEAFLEKVTQPFTAAVGLSGQLMLAFLDGFFLDYDTVVEEAATLFGHDELEDRRFLELLMDYTESEDVDGLASSAWGEVADALTSEIGLEEEHPILQIGAFEQLFLDGVLAHFHEIAIEQPALASFVDFLTADRLDRDSARALVTRDVTLQAWLGQEQRILDRIEGYRARMGDLLNNRDWLFDIAERLEETATEIDSEVVGQSLSRSQILPAVSASLNEIHERQNTSPAVKSAAALERPSQRAVNLLRRARRDFYYADWRGEGYGAACISFGGALWPVGGPRVAERYFREGLAFEPGSALAHYNLYQLELQHERYDKALDHLKVAAACDPDRYEPFDFSLFELVRILGSGGTGVSFEVEYRGRRLVIKALWDPIDIVDPRPALSQLQHLVEVPLSGAEPVYFLRLHRESLCYIVTGFVEGDDLESFREARGGVVPPLQALEIAWRAAEVLAGAHERGLIHRNIKPENLRVGASEHGMEVTLVDFAVPNFVISVPDRVRGVRRFASWSRLGRKVSEALAGYTPPEILQGGPDAGCFQSDIYGLGATLYRLVTGFPPRDIQREVLPPELQDIVMRCVAQDPKDRPANGAELVAELRRLDSRLRSPSELHQNDIQEIDDQLPDLSDLPDLPELGAPGTMSSAPTAVAPFPLEPFPLDPSPGAPSAPPVEGFDAASPAAPWLAPEVAPTEKQDRFGETAAMGLPEGAVDPFGITTADPPPPTAQKTPFGLVSDIGRAPGADSLFSADSEDPFGEAAASADPFGDLGPGEDPFGLLSGVSPGIASPPPFPMPGDPFEQPNQGREAATNDDPFGLSGSQAVTARRETDPFADSSPFGGAASGFDKGRAASPFDVDSAPQRPFNPADSFDESGDEEPLDPMEALKILEELTSRGRAIAAPKQQRPQFNPSFLSDPFDARQDLMGLDAPDDDFGFDEDSFVTNRTALEPAPLSLDPEASDPFSERPAPPAPITLTPPPGLDLAPDLGRPEGLDLPNLPTSLDLPNLPTSLDLPPALDLPGGLDLPLGFDLPTNLDLPPSLDSPLRLESPDALELPEDLQFPLSPPPEAPSLAAPSPPIELPAPPGLSLPPGLEPLSGFDHPPGIDPFAELAKTTTYGQGPPPTPRSPSSPPAPPAVDGPPAFTLSSLELPTVSESNVSLAQTGSGVRRERARKARAKDKSDDTGENFGLVISGLGLKSKKEAAVGIIMDILKMTNDEAIDLCRSPVVPVLKRVTKDKAEAAHARFKEAKINCRINRRRRGRR